MAAGAPLTAIVAGITTFSPPPMRLEVRALAADVLLVDDSYNASPASLRAALDAVAALRGRRRVVVVLGEMLELGALRDSAHQEAGTLVAGSGVAHLIVVGDAGRYVAEAAIRAGLAAAAVDHAADAIEAGTALRAAVRSGDLVLVKASRGIGLERAVAALLERYPLSGAGRGAHEEGKPA
ncbi:MAG: hypothetical protein FJX78_10710 [Armatimonadetes bacterium]|nr:hypothetical protein [Armatimonadota bacterium]